MTTQQPHQYLRDPMYKDAMRHLQQGAFQEGLTAIHMLRERYPQDNAGLDELTNEMNIRSRVDQYEIEDNRTRRWYLLRVYGLYTLLTAVLVALVVWMVSTYAGVVSNQVELARQQVQEQSAYLQLLATYRNAQNLYRAGRAIDALALYEKVDLQVRSNDYPRENEIFVNLPLELEQAQAMAEIEANYNQALSLLAEEKRSEALNIFRDIAMWNSRYRDVTLQIEELEQYFELEAQLETAEGSFSTGNWVFAINQYEAIRNANPNFQKDVVEDRLFQSYLNAAQAILDEEATPDQLKIAEGYFAKALELRPLDPATMQLRTQARIAVEDALIAIYLNAAEQALTQQADSLAALKLADSYFFKASQVRPGDTTIALKHEMARRYLQAIEDFNRGDWTLVIDALEFVYSEDTHFAAGTATQTLFDAYLARGASNIGAAEYEAALADFQRAAEIANSTTNATLLVVQARSEIARTLGLLARFDEAVQLYRETILDAGLLTRAQETNLPIYNLLMDAEAYTLVGNFKAAYTNYRNALENLNALLNSSTHVVQEGEYLTQIANQYNTTVDAILRANNISSRRIKLNQELIIPNLEEQP